MRRGRKRDERTRRSGGRESGVVTVELLVSGIVPTGLVILMFGVGLNLSIPSLGEILRHPRNLVVATLLQIVLLPALALALIAVFKPAPLVALSIIAIAASPGGALSNAFTHLLGGNLAFSVMMTTVSTILVAATAPAVLAAALASGVLEQGAATRLDPASTTFELLRLALLPIGLGVLVVHLFPRAAARLRGVVDLLGLVALATVILASAVVSLPALRQAAPEFLFQAVLFSLASLMLGVLVSFAFAREDRSACFVEFGARNMPVALLLASGGEPSVELVAFLMCYFLANASALVAMTLISKHRSARVAA